MLDLAGFVRQAIQKHVPLLGVCFGHQLVADALGGRVDRNPRGREMGTKELTLCSQDPVLNDDTRPYLVNMSHVDSVVQLPKGAEVLGNTKQEPHAALRFSRRAWGVQFHPEIDREVMVCYASDRRSQLDSEGLDADQLIQEADDARPGAAVLTRFAPEISGT
jgi:GMP synthase (glutamine-hydrolysing)